MVLITWTPTTRRSAEDLLLGEPLTIKPAALLTNLFWHASAKGLAPPSLYP